MKTFVHSKTRWALSGLTKFSHVGDNSKIFDAGNRYFKKM